jgi:hypothetical protein
MDAHEDTKGQTGGVRAIVPDEVVARRRAPLPSDGLELVDEREAVVDDLERGIDNDRIVGPAPT